ncbi:MAG TPA: hypothetical protein VFV86_08595 [Nitrososphaeraceae archaeon]|nr:hypothetical protein [Nitrososphaeraceae archaeon]
MNNSDHEEPSPNKGEILRVCIQLYAYQDRRITETELSVGELYHEIFGNDGRLDFNKFKSDIDWLTSNGLISLKNNVISIDNEVAKTLIDYVFKHKDEI